MTRYKFLIHIRMLLPLLRTALESRLGSATPSRMMSAFYASSPMRPDKKIITDEVWDDARVRGFLAPKTPQGADAPDFLVLLGAYRAMRVDDFARFIRFCVEEKHDLNATNEGGQTFVEVIATHRHGKPFAEIMSAAGARSARTS
jgi:hypothetical protein